VFCAVMPLAQNTGTSPSAISTASPQSGALRGVHGLDGRAADRPQASRGLS
jgi:hypothetical protein